MAAHRKRNAKSKFDSIIFPQGHLEDLPAKFHDRTTSKKDHATSNKKLRRARMRRNAAEN